MAKQIFANTDQELISLLRPPRANVDVLMRSLTTSNSWQIVAVCSTNTERQNKGGEEIYNTEQERMSFSHRPK